MTKSERYSRLAPFSIEQRVKLALAAISFFSPLNHTKNSDTLGKPCSSAGTIQPFSGRDFGNYIDVTGVLPHADRHMFRLRDLLSLMERADLLIPAGQNTDVILGRQYYFMRELTEL
jgi:hypothetical protein